MLVLTTASISSWLMKSNVAVALAFCWDSRKASTIGAIVVDGEFAANPPQSSVLSSIKVLELLLIPPTFALRLAELSIHRCLATVDMEASVGGYEGSICPVCLLQPSPRGPVIRIPKARVYLHRLVEWKPHSYIFAVLEHSDWHIIY